MKSLVAGLSCTGLALLLSGVPAGAAGSWTIVVNLGSHETVQAAADSYRRANWLDADLTDDTIATESFAALELRSYLCKLTGADAGNAEAFPIVDDDRPPDGPAILVGNAETNRQVAARPDAAELEDREGPVGSFRIRSRPGEGRVVLAGRDRVGTLYAAYAFLEALGCRWFAPGEVHEEVPRLKDLTVPELNVDERPAFRTRGFWAWEDRGTDEFYLWMARNRMNYWTVECKDPAALKRLGIRMTCGGHHPQYRFLHPNQEYPYNHADFSGDEAKGADPYPRGEGKGDANHDGKLTYGEAHPEWYGLQDGKRSFRFEYDFGDNYCTSNPHATAEFMKNLVADLAGGQWKWADSINFWLFDGGRWCQCKACEALGTPTDRNLLVVHALSKAIDAARASGQLNREVSVEFLAYHDVIQPPTRPLPADFNYDRCAATFFPIVRCYVHPFTSEACTEYNRRYYREYQGWTVAPNRHYKGQIFIGEYYNVSGYKNLPVVFSRVMAEDIPYYYRTGARHMHYMHTAVGNWGTRALTNWQMARMLWNPSADVAAMREDYFSKRYGPAANVMRAFYDRLETALCNVTPLKYTLARGLGAGREDLFPHKHMKLEPTRFETDDGPDLLEMLADMQACRMLIDYAGGMNLPERIRLRIAEDAALFAYGHRTVEFLTRLVLVDRYLRGGREDAARAEFARVDELAQALRADTRSTSFASSHANAKDGLEASFAEPAYERFQKRFAEKAAGR